jgi:hypothetical protein
LARKIGGDHALTAAILTVQTVLVIVTKPKQMKLLI